MNQVKVGLKQCNINAPFLWQLGEVLKRTPHPTPETSEIQGLALFIIHAFSYFCLVRFYY